MVLKKTKTKVGKSEKENKRGISSESLTFIQTIDIRTRA